MVVNIEHGLNKKKKKQSIPKLIVLKRLMRSKEKLVSRNEDVQS